MIKKIFLLGSILGLFFLASCSKDDDGVKELTIEEQNEADDLAIINFLNSYYFDDLGKVQKFSGSVTNKDKPALKVNAVKDPLGFWYVVNPDASKGTGDHPNSTNNILIHYNLQYFTATQSGEGYASLKSASSTIDGSGFPTENPYFYKKPANDTSQSENYYVAPGLVKGLSYFLPTNKSKNDVYDKLQGVIIVPSRLAYARNSNWLNLNNATFILNFELYKVCPENTKCN